MSKNENKKTEKVKLTKDELLAKIKSKYNNV